MLVVLQLAVVGHSDEKKKKVTGRAIAVEAADITGHFITKSFMCQSKKTNAVVRRRSHQTTNAASIEFRNQSRLCSAENMIIMTENRQIFCQAGHKNIHLSFFITAQSDVQDVRKIEWIHIQIL